MPAKWMICPDMEKIEIEKCLSVKGCRMKERCIDAFPMLRQLSFDREWRGITASMAGNGVRQIFLKATTDYAINPKERMFALLGTLVHSNLARDHLTDNVLAEERSKTGTPDLLHEDENNDGKYILTDYKTWGSFKVAKALGIIATKKAIPILDGSGNPILLKSGKNKGELKTKVETTFSINPDEIDIRDVELQTNRYRIGFEENGFPVSKMQVLAIVRDGGTYIAQNRGITDKVYTIPIQFRDDDWVIDYYKKLEIGLADALCTGYFRRCDEWESWENRRCESFCEVADACKAMDEQHIKEV